MHGIELRAVKNGENCPTELIILVLVHLPPICGRTIGALRRAPYQNLAW